MWSCLGPMLWLGRIDPREWMPFLRHSSKIMITEKWHGGQIRYGCSSYLNSGKCYEEKNIYKF